MFNLKNKNVQYIYLSLFMSQEYTISKVKFRIVCTLIFLKIK